MSGALTSSAPVLDDAAVATAASEQHLTPGTRPEARSLRARTREQTGDQIRHDRAPRSYDEWRSSPGRRSDAEPVAHGPE